MARIADPRVAYTVIDTDYSSKTLALKVRLKFGLLGHVVLFEVLNWINDGKGCYAEYDEDTAMTFALHRLGDLNYTEKAEEIFRYMVAIGFFDPEAFAQDQVLTSEGIVRRWATSKKNPGAYELPPSVGRLLRGAKRGISPAEIPQNGTLSRTNGDKSVKTGISPAEIPKNGTLSRTNGDKSVKAEKAEKEKEKEKEEKKESSYKEKKEERERPKEKYYPPLTPPAGGSVGVVGFSDSPDPSGFTVTAETVPRDSPDGLSADDSAVVRTWNEIFPRGDPRHLFGPPYALNAFFFANLHQARKEGFTLAEFREAFLALRDQTTFSWQIHSAVKPDNVRTLLTQRHIRAQPRGRAQDLDDKRGDKGYSDPNSYAPLEEWLEFIYNPESRSRGGAPCGY